MTAAGAGSRRKLCVETFIVFHMTKNYKGLKRKEGNLLNTPFPPLSLLCTYGPDIYAWNFIGKLKRAAAAKWNRKRKKRKTRVLQKSEH